MAAAGEAWDPPLLSWKGMQLWSVGCRAPAICEIFVGFKAKKLSNLISTNSGKKKGGKRRKRREGEDATNLSEEPPPSPPPPPGCSSLQLPGGLSCRSSLDDVPKRHSISFEEKRSSNLQLRRNSDATASNLQPNSHILRRNSDASLCNLQRLSTSSSCSGYERVWVLEGGDDGGLDYMLPREVKLGGRRSDVSGHLGRQDSAGMSAHGRSSCSSFSSSSSSVASAASAAAAKLAGRRSSASSESEQRHLSHLLVGNQFLTHLTAAPVASTAIPHIHLHPSEGFLLDASVRCREAELKDRIIFFV